MNEKPLTGVIAHEDRLLYNEHLPFCSNADCQCHMDRETIGQVLIIPLQEGLLTGDELARIYTGRQLAE